MTLVDSLPIIWLLVILAAIFTEALTERLWAIWFAPASVIALVLGFFGVPEYFQVITFIASAVFMILLSFLIRMIAHRKRNKHKYL